jgi:hypothetical protein
MRISTILSDYDGTLLPTTLIHNSDTKHESFTDDFSQTLLDLEKVLWEISNKIIVGIISTKDFNFLHYKTRFANILSCIMSIETIIIKHSKSETCYKDNCIQKSILNIDSKILKMNSEKLESLGDQILVKFKNLSIDRKLAFNPTLLAGITIDWRHLGNWNSIKKQVEPFILNLVNNENNNNNNNNNTSKYPLFVQTYSSHPFIDIYSTVCSKEIAYDNISKIIRLHMNKMDNKNIIYLGDSENDNPAFRKADVSIGIKSDDRLNPKLDCQYTINFNQLPKFLTNLLKNDFIFSKKLL